MTAIILGKVWDVTGRVVTVSWDPVSGILTLAAGEDEIALHGEHRRGLLDAVMRAGNVAAIEAAERGREFEVLGKDATATCLAHRRPVRWEPAPCWWYHDMPGDTGPPESRQCPALWNIKAPIAVVRRASAAARIRGEES